MAKRGRPKGSGKKKATKKRGTEKRGTTSKGRKASKSRGRKAAVGTGLVAVINAQREQLDQAESLAIRHDEIQVEQHEIKSEIEELQARQRELANEAEDIRRGLDEMSLTDKVVAPAPAPAPTVISSDTPEKRSADEGDVPKSLVLQAREILVKGTTPGVNYSSVTLKTMMKVNDFDPPEGKSLSQVLGSVIQGGAKYFERVEGERAMYLRLPEEGPAEGMNEEFEGVEEDMETTDIIDDHAADDSDGVDQAVAMEEATAVEQAV